MEARQKGMNDSSVDDLWMIYPWTCLCLSDNHWPLTSNDRARGDGPDLGSPVIKHKRWPSRCREQNLLGVPQRNINSELCFLIKASVVLICSTLTTESKSLFLFCVLTLLPSAIDIHRGYFWAERSCLLQWGPVLAKGSKCVQRLLTLLRVSRSGHAITTLALFINVLCWELFHVCKRFDLLASQIAPNCAKIEIVTSAASGAYRWKLL